LVQAENINAQLSKYRWNKLRDLFYHFFAFRATWIYTAGWFDSPVLNLFQQFSKMTGTVRADRINRNEAKLVIRDENGETVAKSSQLKNRAC